MASTGETKTGFVPLTFARGERRYDLAIPAATPFAEIVPAVVDEMGLLTPAAASAGFRLLDELGEEVPLHETAAEAGVGPGAVLQVEQVGEGDGERQYDDLVEALGVAVEAGGSAWTPRDSLNMAAAAAMALLLVVAAVLWRTGGLLAIVTAGGTAVLTFAAAAVVLRMRNAVAAVLLHGCAAVLAGVAAAALFQDGMRLIAAGGAVLLSGVLGYATLRAPAGTAAKPVQAAMPGLLYGGVVLLWAGICRTLLGLEPRFAAATIVTVTALIVLMAPWIALAQTPLRSYIPRTQEERMRDTEVYVEGRVRAHEGFGRAFVLALRITGGLVLLASLPWLISDSVPAMVLTGSVGVSLLLATRQIFDRSEVIIGVISGAGVLVLGIALLAFTRPQLAVWAVWALIGVAALVLLFGVIRRSNSAAATRAADLCSVLALLAIVPSAALSLGIV